MYDLIYQVNASKRIGVITGLKDTGNPLAYIFEDFQFPDDVEDGEMSCYLIYNGRKDVVYEFKDVPLNTILHTGDGDVALKNLRPEIFLLRLGLVQSDAVYREKDVQYYYRKK